MSETVLSTLRPLHDVWPYPEVKLSSIQDSHLSLLPTPE
jgi:hypothetical protein